MPRLLNEICNCMQRFQLAVEHGIRLIDQSCLRRTAYTTVYWDWRACVQF